MTAALARPGAVDVVEGRDEYEQGHTESRSTERAAIPLLNGGGPPRQSSDRPRLLHDARGREGSP